MNDQRKQGSGSVPSHRAAPRVAVIGGGFAGLSCARELHLRGHHPVVFEASGRLGGRASSLDTRIGCFDDGAQTITGESQLAAYAAQRPGELPATHPWTVPATAAEDENKGPDRDRDVDEALLTRTLKPLGLVGVPSMRALANAVARPLEVRLNTPIHHARRRGASWVLHDAVGERHEDFQALVLAIPAPFAQPLAGESPLLAAALQAVHYRSRWVLLLGTERPVGLPGYREFQGSPIERVAAMHSKPGRSAAVPQRWFIEADERWSLQHEHDNAETVSDLLLDIFCAHAGRSVTPNFLRARQWRHAFVQTPVAALGQSEYLWDEAVQLGVCGDSVVASQVDRVHRSGVALAARIAESPVARREQTLVRPPLHNARDTFEAQAVHS